MYFEHFYSAFLPFLYGSFSLLIPGKMKGEQTVQKIREREKIKKMD